MDSRTVLPLPPAGTKLPVARRKSIAVPRSVAAYILHEPELGMQLYTLRCAENRGSWVRHAVLPAHGSVRQRVRPHLKMHHLGQCPFGRFAVEGCARAPRGPHPFAFPAGLRIVD